MENIELGTYYLKDTVNRFERHWFMGGNKGSAYEEPGSQWILNKHKDQEK